MSVLNDVINQASIRDMLDYYGVEKQGNAYVCPFHDDTHPSLTVTADDKHFSCFVCHENGNIDNLVEKMEKKRGREMDYVHRMNMIIKLQNLNVDFTLHEGVKKTLTPEEKREQLLYNIMSDAMLYAENCLASKSDESADAARYLSLRGISPETIKTFHIGYNHNAMLQETLQKKYKWDDLFTVGVLAQADNGRYYDHQYNRVVIPILNNEGKCVAFGGRYLGTDDKAPKYKNTKVTELFKKGEILFNYYQARQHIRTGKEVYVVEGYFDAVSAHEMGLKNTVALMGVELTNHHLELIKELNVPVTLCLDNDKAGRNATFKMIPTLLVNGIEVNVINTKALNKGKDMNDVLLAGETPETFNKFKVTAIEFMSDMAIELSMTSGEVTLDTIEKAYKLFTSIPELNTTGNEVKFFDYISRQYDYSREDVVSVCKPTMNSSCVSEAMRNMFCGFVKEQVAKYAQKSGNEVLQAFVVQGRLTQQHILTGMNNERFIQNNGKKLVVTEFCKDYLLQLPEYLEYQKNYDHFFDKLLENVHAYDKSGQMIKLDHLTAAQKDKVIEQFHMSFDDETIESMKEMSQRFIKLYIADNTREYEMFLGNNYSPVDKPALVQKFNEGKMGIINYRCCFQQSDLERYHKSRPNYFTTEDGKDYQCVIVFNNTNNALDLQPDNYIMNDIMSQFAPPTLADRELMNSAKQQRGSVQPAQPQKQYGHGIPDNKQRHIDAE